MTLAEDLLSQARHLANLDAGKPRQASLRRAVSTAYYALFQPLIAEAEERLCPGTPRALATRMSRSFVHADMTQACKAIAASSVLPIFRELLPGGFSTALRSVASAFVELQDEMHRADYDLSVRYTRTRTLDFVEQSQGAFLAWQAIRASDEANVFLTALLLHKAWSR